MNRPGKALPGFLHARLVSVMLAGLLLASCASNSGNTTAEAPRTLGETETRLLLAGDDRGTARVAELNGYPDPERVLKHSEALQLTADQRFKLTRLNSTAKGKARAMGQRIVDAERELDLFLAATRMTGEKPVSDAIHAQLDTIAGLHAMLRTIHVDARLEAHDILNESQRVRYADIANVPPPAQVARDAAAETPTPLY
jgi:hypothetical protein